MMDQFDEYRDNLATGERRTDPLGIRPDEERRLAEERDEIMQQQIDEMEDYDDPTAAMNER